MNKQMRILTALFVTIVLGAVWAHGTAQQNDLAYQSHPVVCIITDFFCSFFAGLIFYFGSGLFVGQKEKRLKKAIVDEFHDNAAPALRAEQPVFPNDKNRIPYTRIASWMVESGKVTTSAICDVLIQEKITSTEELEQIWLPLCIEITSFYTSRIIDNIMHDQHVSGRENFMLIYKKLEKAVFEFGRAYPLVSDISFIVDAITSLETRGI